jgi:hypothetical protein
MGRILMLILWIFAPMTAAALQLRRSRWRWAFGVLFIGAMAAADYWARTTIAGLAALAPDNPDVRPWCDLLVHLTDAFAFMCVALYVMGLAMGLACDVRNLAAKAVWALLAVAVLILANFPVAMVVQEAETSLSMLDNNQYLPPDLR